MQVYLSGSKKLKTNIYRKPTYCMMVLHFHSHHSFSCKEGIIYSQALQYNSIISEDHILQEDLNNLTHILLAHTYPLHFIIKNIKKALFYNHSNLPSPQTPHSEGNIPPIITSFSDIGKSFRATIHKNWHTINNDTTLPTI